MEDEDMEDGAMDDGDIEDEDMGFPRARFIVLAGACLALLWNESS